VEIREDQSDFAISVSITGQLLVDMPYPNDVFGGTQTGFPNSSATNWLWGGTHWYKVVLHCTSNPCRSTDRSARRRDATATPAGSSPSADALRAEPCTGAV
jgi:hypothetical protein